MWPVLHLGLLAAATLLGGSGGAAPSRAAADPDAPGRLVVSASIAVPATAARLSERPAPPAATPAAGGPAPRTVLAARPVRRAGDGRFSFAIPRSPVFGTGKDRGHVVAFGEFAAPPCPPPPAASCPPSGR